MKLVGSSLNTVLEAQSFCQKSKQIIREIKRLKNVSRKLKITDQCIACSAKKMQKYGGRIADNFPKVRRMPI